MRLVDADYIKASVKRQCDNCRKEGMKRMADSVERAIIEELDNTPTAQPERLTDDDFETIRIHLNAYKEKLCNQQRWEEAEEYQRIIDRFMAFASAQPETHDKRTETHACDLINRQQAIDAINALHEKPNAWLDSAVDAVMTLPSAQPERKKGKWIILPPIFEEICQCSNCKMKFKDALQWTNYCPNCRADMRGENE